MRQTKVPFLSIAGIGGER